MTEDNAWDPPQQFADIAWRAGYKTGMRDASPLIADEYHTMAELYEYRMLYNAAFAWCGQTDFEVVKSFRHSDGELCFGGGWFVVVMDLPTGQVSNHYETKHWDLFRVPEVDKAPFWDGHTPEVAADRLRRYSMGELK